MKKVILLLSVATVLVACNKSGSTDKKTELANLKKQQSEVTAKIIELEAAIAKEDPDANKKIHSIELAPIVEGVFTHYVEVQGKVESEQNVNIIPRAMGPITNVSVQPGDNVRKGQLLATIDNALIKKNIDELQNRLDLAIIVFNKQKNLWDQKIGTEIQFLQAKNNKEALERSMATANEQLDMTLIKSPINGSVDLVDVKVGEMASNMKPAFRVVNLEQLKATAELAESYLSTVSTGDEATIVFSDLNKEVKSKVSFTGRVINPVSRTFSVDVKLNNSNEYRPNMIAVMKIVDYRALKSISIPMNVIQNDQTGQYVMVAVEQNGKLIATKKVIKSGMIYKGVAEIKSGLAVNDKLIVAGFQDLVEGDLIKL